MGVHPVPSLTLAHAKLQNRLVQSISPEQKTFFKEQLNYSHFDYLPPSNTLAVNQIQHGMILEAVRSFAKNNPVHMLDVGCGWGDFSEKLEPYLKSYIGIDPSVSELQQFSLRPNRAIIRGVGEFMDFVKDQSRNFILLNSVIDHAFDWKKLFANCLRILTPGGLMVISMENSLKLPVRLRKWLGRPVVHEGHFSFWSVPEVEQLLGTDFNIVEKRTFGYLFGFHQLTERVPLPLGLMRVLNRMANKVFGYFDSNGGAILFFSAIRKGTPEKECNFENALCCPNCHADWDFGAKSCLQCGCEFIYTDHFMDSVAMNPSLKEDAGLR